MLEKDFLAQMKDGSNNYKKYKQELNKILHSMEGQIEERVWHECKMTDKFKEYVKDKQLIKCMDIL